MRILPPSSSLEIYWDSIVYTLATLEAWPETAPLGAELAAHLEAGEALGNRARAVRRDVVRANAKVAAADLGQERHLTALGHDVLALTGLDYGAPAFTFLFDRPLSVLKRHALERQTTVIEEICARLAHAMYPDELRQKHLPVLQADVAHARDLLDTRRQAWLARASLRLEQDAWKREANALRTALYAELLALHPAEGRSFAERFFADTPSAEPEAPAPADPA